MYFFFSVIIRNHRQQSNFFQCIFWAHEFSRNSFLLYTHTWMLVSQISHIAGVVLLNIYKYMTSSKPACIISTSNWVIQRFSWGIAFVLFIFLFLGQNIQQPHLKTRDIYLTQFPDSNRPVYAWQVSREKWHSGKPWWGKATEPLAARKQTVGVDKLGTRIDPSAMMLCLLIVHDLLSSWIDKSTEEWNFPRSNFLSSVPDW